MNLRFYLFVSDVSQVVEGGRGGFKISYCQLRGLRASTHTYRELGGVI